MNKPTHVFGEIHVSHEQVKWKCNIS